MVEERIGLPCLRVVLRRTRCAGHPAKGVGEASAGTGKPLLVWVVVDGVEDPDELHASTATVAGSCTVKR